jgi:hypothetical protein
MLVFAAVSGSRARRHALPFALGALLLAAGATACGADPNAPDSTSSGAVGDTSHTTPPGGGGTGSTTGTGTGTGAGVGLTAFTPRGDTRLVGVWTTGARDLVIVFLPDGRTASHDDRLAASVRAESGVYRADGDVLAFDWLISGVERDYLLIDDGALVLSQSPNVPVGAHLSRVGDAAAAATRYEQIAQEARTTAAAFQPNVPTTRAAGGRIDLGPEVVRDPQPTDVIAGATVYADNGRFQWVDPSGRQYERLGPDEPGVTAQSYTFLPNGRFVYDGWLYGIALDAADWVGEPLTDAQRQQRTVPMKHYQYWGKYRVVAGNGDPAEGELVEIVFPDGSRATLRVVAGRGYLHRVGSALTFENYRHFELRRAQRG